MRNKPLANYGEDIWEKKIKMQKEVGVISGNMGTLREIRKNTEGLMNLFDKEIRPLIKNNVKILDLGVGPLARFSIEFAKRGHDITGIDISETTLKYAKRYIEKNNVKVKLIKRDITQLDNLKDKFDFVFCAATFYHIPKHLTGITLVKVKEILKKNGRFFVEFGVDREKNLQRKIWRIFYNLGHKSKTFFGRGFNVNCSKFTSKEIEEMVDRSGFIIEKKFREDRFLLRVKK